MTTDISSLRKRDVFLAALKGKPVDLGKVYWKERPRLFVKIRRLGLISRMSEEETIEVRPRIESRTSIMAYSSPVEAYEAYHILVPFQLKVIARDAGAKEHCMRISATTSGHFVMRCRSGRRNQWYVVSK